MTTVSLPAEELAGDQIGKDPGVGYPLLGGAELRAGELAVSSWTALDPRSPAQRERSGFRFSSFDTGWQEPREFLSADAEYQA